MTGPLKGLESLQKLEMFPSVTRLYSEAACGLLVQCNKRLQSVGIVLGESCMLQGGGGSLLESGAVVSSI